MKPFKITLKLREDAAPHLYIHQLKKQMEDDNYLHPMMKGALLTLKKARMPFIRLAQTKEIVLVPNKHMHFERATEPEIHAWGKVEWTEEEIESFEKNPKDYIKQILKVYDLWGYEFFNEEEQSEEEIEKLEKLCKKKDKKNKWWKTK